MAASGQHLLRRQPQPLVQEGLGVPAGQAARQMSPGGKAAHCHLVGPEAQLQGVGPHPGQSGRPLQELPGPEGGQHTVGQHKGLYPCGHKGQGHRLSLRRGNALVSPAGEDLSTAHRAPSSASRPVRPRKYMSSPVSGAPPPSAGWSSSRETRRQSMPATPFQSTLNPSIPAGFPFEKGKIKKVLTNRACTDKNLRCLDD